jgi:hypothetical protein
VSSREKILTLYFFFVFPPNQRSPKDERSNEPTHALHERTNQIFLDLIVEIMFRQDFVDYLFYPIYLHVYD